MRNDFLGADWSANHHRLSADMHKLIRAIGNSFDVLNRQQFAAPWASAPRPAPLRQSALKAAAAPASPATSPRRLIA